MVGKERMDEIVEQAEQMAAGEHTLEDRERASARVFREIANTILPRSVRMVEDTPWNHQSGYLPILDTEMKVEDGRYIHRHYSKPMASLEVIQARSSMSKGAKISILTQEGSRRLRNCSVDLDWDEKVMYLNKLMISMIK